MSGRLFLQLNAFTKEDRIPMTARVSDAINRAGAWITDFHQYSNISICINFQVTGENMGTLGEALQGTGLHLSEGSLQQLTSALGSTDAALAVREIPGTLQITFVHNEPDLIREVPAVPG